eukprot:7399272-Lingulodinium_polyedra.AAC.1
MGPLSGRWRRTVRFAFVTGQEPPCSMWSHHVLSGVDRVEGFGRGIAGSTVLNAEPPCSMRTHRVVLGADRVEGFGREIARE